MIIGIAMAKAATRNNGYRKFTGTKIREIYDLNE